MNGILIAMFGIVLIGLVLLVYFFKNKTSENFQVGSSSFGNLIETDLFINTSATIRQYDLSGFSIIKQLIKDHRNFVKDERIYGGWFKDRHGTFNCPAYGLTNAARVNGPVHNIAFDPNGISAKREYNDALTLIQNGIRTYLYNFKRIPVWNVNELISEMSAFRGLGIGPQWFRDIRPYCRGLMNDFGDIIRDNDELEVCTGGGSYPRVCETRIRSMIQRYEDAGIYLYRPVQPPIITSTYSQNRYGSSSPSVWEYDGPGKGIMATSEIHRLNIYGDVTGTQLINFRESMIYGLMFDFSDAYNIEKYLRIPYDSPTFSGVDLYFSHGKFLNDVKPKSAAQYYLYDLDGKAFIYNKNLTALLTNTDLTVPTTFDSNTIILGNGGSYINKGTSMGDLVNFDTHRGHGDTILDANTLLHPGGEITGSRYALTSMNITHKYIGKMTPTMLALLPQATRTYVTSWAYNRTIRILDKRLEDISDARAKCVFLLERAQVASGTSANRIPDEFITTRNNFRSFATTYANVRSGTVPNVDNCIGDFKFRVGKITPNYGGELNLQNKNFLNNIAQKYYEYSEGLSEMIYIYEIIRIGSNMLDIRFDKQQRLPPNDYIYLRNQYNTNIEEYNYLYNIYYENRWQDKYNTIKEVQNALSTSRVKLQPVLNPVYPIGGLGTLTSLNSQLSANKTNMLALGEQLTAQTNALTSRAGSSNIASVITSVDATSYSHKQTLYNSTIEADSRLTNLINGITTGVARIFYTNGATPVVNGMVIGINGALSYNTVYNGSIEVDIGNTPGNVNYYPEIVYTKNVTPPILCSNVDFIKRVTQLYEDNINNSLSSFTKTVYNSNVGEVFVDKVLGFKQIDSNACGFTWQETEYDYYTNKPNIRRLLNVVLPFKYDNSVYQEPQLLIDNSLANGIQIIDRGTIPLNRYNINRTTLASLESSLASTRTQLQTYLASNLSQFNTISNKYYTSGDFVGGTATLPSAYIVNDIRDAVLGNRANLDYFKRLNNYESLKKIYTAGFFHEPAVFLRNKTFYDNFITYSNTLSNKITVLQNSVSVTRCNVIQSSNIGSNYPFGTLDKNIYTDGLDKLLTYNNNIKTRENSMRAYASREEVKNTVQTYFENLSLYNIYPTDVSELNNISIFLYPYIDFSGINPLTIPNQYYRDNLTYYKYLKESIQSVENMQSNREIIIERILIDKIKLYNGYGVCQPEYTCKSREIMSQVMEQYNTDKNNNNIILRILNAYTVSPYECHYTMDLKNRSNNNITRTSKSFVITADYRDCKYYVVEYGSNNTGWFVSENQNPPLAPNSYNSQIAGYQYIGGVLSDYYNNVKNVVTPYITEASNRGNSLYNAIKKQRLDTYFGLGGIQTINIPSCSNVDYSILINMLSNNERFKKDIFTNYYIYNNCTLWPSKIVSVGIGSNNIIDVSFDVNNINDNFSMGNKSIRSTRFSITTTMGYCDYTTNVLCNITPDISKVDLINMSNRNFPAVNNSVSNVNIINTKTLVPITMTKKIFHKIINKIRDSNNDSAFSYFTSDGNNILVGYAITPNKIYLKVRYIRSGLTATQTAYRMFTCAYNFDNLNNIIITDINVRNYIYTAGQPDPDTMIQYISPQLSGFGTFLPVSIFNSYIYSGSTRCANINFNDNVIKSLTGLSNIVSYIASPSEINLCEYCVDTSPEIIPMIKRTFKVKFYIDDFNRIADCNKIDVLYVVPATRENTFYRITQSDITNQTLLNTLRTRFNSDNSKETTGYTYSSVLTKFYSGVLYNNGIVYKVGIHYKNSSVLSDINFNKKPNDLMFNNPLYIYFVVERNENFEYNLDTYTIIDAITDPSIIFTNISDINFINTYQRKGYYIEMFKYKYITIVIKNNNNGNIDLTQLQFYNDSISKNANIVKIYKRELVEDTGYYRYTEIPNISFLYTPNNISDITRFTKYTIQHNPSHDASLLIEFSEPTTINRFSFVSGASVTNKLKKWKVYGIFSTQELDNIHPNYLNYSESMPNFPNVILLDSQNTDLVYNTRYYQTPSFAFSPDQTDIVLPQLPNIPDVANMNTCITPTSSLFNSYRDIIKTFVFSSGQTPLLRNQIYEMFDTGSIDFQYITYGTDDVLKTAIVFLEDSDDEYIYGNEYLLPVHMKMIYIKIDNTNYRINTIFRVKTYVELISSDYSTTGNYDYQGVRYFYFNFYVDVDSGNPCILNPSISVIYDMYTLSSLYSNIRYYLINGNSVDGTTADSFLTSNGFISYIDAFTNPPNKISKKKVIPLTKENLQKYYNQKVNHSIYPEFKKKYYDITNKNYYLMYDEYDLNRNLLRKNMVIGMTIKNNKVINIIYYEDDDGARDAFDLSDKKVKRYWDNKIGLPLAFEDF